LGLAAVENPRFAPWMDEVGQVRRSALNFSWRDLGMIEAAEGTPATSF
jgi:hypothetical protein